MKLHANVCYITTRSVNCTCLNPTCSSHVLSTNTSCRLHVFSCYKPFKDQYCMMQNCQFYKGNPYKKSVFLLLLSLHKLTLFRKKAKLPSFLVRSICQISSKLIAFQQNFSKNPMKIISLFFSEISLEISTKLDIFPRICIWKSRNLSDTLCIWSLKSTEFGRASFYNITFYFQMKYMYEEDILKEGPYSYPFL